jgi:hypothetical protein
MNPFLNHTAPQGADRPAADHPGAKPPAAGPGDDEPSRSSPAPAPKAAPEDTQGKGSSQADRTREYDADAWWSGQG